MPLPVGSDLHIGNQIKIVCWEALRTKLGRIQANFGYFFLFVGKKLPTRRTVVNAIEKIVKAILSNLVGVGIVFSHRRISPQETLQYVRVLDPGGLLELGNTLFFIILNRGFSDVGILVKPSSISD